MKSKATNFFRNFSYAIISNIVSLTVSTLAIFIIPKLIGVEEYGYWQLYIFYALYVGFFHFGWNDGIYLRYGGESYKNLDKGLFFSQFYSLFFFQSIIAILISTFSFVVLNDENRVFIIFMVALNLILVNTSSMLQFILQATNRIKEYSLTILFGRILYLLLIIFFLALGFREYKIMIVADIISKLLALLYAMILSRDIVFRKANTFYFNYREVVINISVGIKLMLANITSMLIIGTVRFGIERSWSVETFGKVSLTLSVSNLMMLFINAVGIVLFPILRRIDERRLPSLYVTMREPLMALLLGVLILYFPIKVILSAWLPNYADSLLYMALVFPMFVYEGKMALLINTYLKTIRQEKLMLKINIISFIVSIVITVITTLIIKNLNFAVFSIVFLIALRSIIAELYLSRILSVKVYKNIFLELVISLNFILVGWFIDSWIAVLLYLFSYIIYLAIKKKDIAIEIKNIISLIKV